MYARARAGTNYKLLMIGVTLADSRTSKVREWARHGLLIIEWVGFSVWPRSSRLLESEVTAEFHQRGVRQFVLIVFSTRSIVDDAFCYYLPCNFDVSF